MILLQIEGECFLKLLPTGVIEQVGDQFGLQRLTRWKIVGDSVENLRKIMEALGEG